MDIAAQLLENFSRIAAADGGGLELIEAGRGRIRMGYRPGGAVDCAEGVCALPQAELEAMMRAWLARAAPDMQLIIEPLQE